MAKPPAGGVIQCTVSTFGYFVISLVFFRLKEKYHYYSQASSALSIVKSRTTSSEGVGAIGFVPFRCIVCDDE